MNRLLQHFVASPTGASDASRNSWTTNRFNEFSSQSNTFELGYHVLSREHVEINNAHTVKESTKSHEYDEDDVSSLFQTDSTNFLDLAANTQQGGSNGDDTAYQGQQILPAEVISKEYDTVDLDEDSSPLIFETPSENTGHLPSGNSWFTLSSNVSEEQSNSAFFSSRPKQDETIQNDLSVEGSESQILLSVQQDDYFHTESISTASELFGQSSAPDNKARSGEENRNSNLWNSTFASSSHHSNDTVREDFVVVSKPEAENFTQVLDLVSDEVVNQGKEVELRDPIYDQASAVLGSRDLEETSDPRLVEMVVSAHTSHENPEVEASTSRGQLHPQNEVESRTAFLPHSTGNDLKTDDILKECATTPIREEISRLTESFKKTIERLHRENSQLLQQLADHAGAFALMKRKTNELEAQISKYQMQEQLLCNLLSSAGVDSNSRA
uniref:AlNc14C6G891 protein n=1 Tax=Albugo laibachii Nc14 TaxID=890382 RepID=F0W1C2_9STRA|nr:AlNc14C6G891 [Albugo laibachii Nc14]|eukprot:CCA14850.1 AlNc14C6G891 [Albugo laibachii Nc14]